MLKIAHQLAQETNATEIERILRKLTRLIVDAKVNAGRTDTIFPQDHKMEIADRSRCKLHSKQILKRLKRGPATNHELTRYGMRVAARIHDLRKAGYLITSIRIDNHGTWEYRLEH
jgi:hypothetical protein